MRNTYDKLLYKLQKVYDKLNTPLTLTEKILYTHLYDDNDIHAFRRGEEYALFAPDRVAMQDATAQMVLLQLMNTGVEKVKVPASIHCDHLITSKHSQLRDVYDACMVNKKVYEFLISAANKYGIDYWHPGSGIIHQIVLENYAFPGGMIVGTDSHTPNAGGMCMAAIGVGGNDAVDVMIGQPWELKVPRIIGVELKGRLNEWCSPKDIILYLVGKLGVKGGTDCVFEYFGEGTKTISCTGKTTICNMGAEMGATFSIFPYDIYTTKYLFDTNRLDLIQDLDYYRKSINFEADPGCHYDEVITIELDKLVPYVNGPGSPDVCTPLSEMEQYCKSHDWTSKIDDVLIGSCTNSSYEDLVEVAEIIASRKDKLKSKVWLNPGSADVLNKLRKQGYIKTFTEAGVNIMACACGPCIGQWDRKDSDKKLPNNIVTTFNRNFVGRNDGNPNTRAFITSPKIAILLAYAGRFTDVTKSNTSTAWKRKTPVYINDSMELNIPEGDDRLQKLKPFDSWSKFFDHDALNIECELLAKVKGKCTTDHISPGGPWLKYRGHLENISKNLLIRAINAFNGLPCTNVPEDALSLKKRDKNAIIIAEDNYGEGSSREHAAMEPRFMGVRVVIAKSFARIHETNLKKQGILALTFSDPNDYDKIQEHDTFEISSSNIKDGTVDVCIKHLDGTVDNIKCNHSYNETQLNWLKAGSSINYFKTL